jgi:hypothetical protein
MKTISLIAAGVLALGWGTAMAETSPSAVTSGPPDDGTMPPPHVSVDGDVDPAPPVIPADETPGPTTNVEVNTPPVNVDVIVNPPVAAAPAAVAPVATQPYANSERGRVYRSSLAPHGGGLFVGGGFEDFTSDNLRNMTGSGGYWSARIVGGMRRIVGLEAAYVGSARNIDTLGLDRDARLISNGAEGAVRLNIPIVSWNQMSLIEPFGFIGLGWSHYNVTNTNINTSDVASSDDVMTMPLGGGLTFGHGPVMADARFTYRKIYNNDLVTGRSLDTWGVGGQIGFGF